MGSASFHGPKKANASFDHWMAQEARWFELRQGPDADDRAASGSDILAAIRHNEALHQEEAERYERPADHLSERRGGS